MRTGRTVVALAVPLLLVVACGKSEMDRGDVETKYTYSLCPSTVDARQKLLEQVRAFAGQQNAEVIDRSAGAQHELSELKSNVLDQTGGSPILLTIQKAEDFRISVTNLGLKEKIALTIRTWRKSGADRAVAALMDDLGRYWTIRRVEGGVTDDPPC